MKQFTKWPFNWFGFWGPSVEEPLWPRMDVFIDPDWDPQEKSAVLSYLDRAVVVTIAGIPSTKCGICGEDIGNPSAYKSDGVWLWPLGLSHDVRRHGVRLPDRMVEHMRRNGFKPPENIKVDVPNLPWPP